MLFNFRFLIRRMRFSQTTRKGMTLVELLVAIAIMLIGIEGVNLLFIRSWNTNKFVLEMGNASFIASRGTSKVVSEIRKTRQADNGDYPIESGDKFDLKVYMDIDSDGATERVHYYLLSNTFYRGVTNPVAGLPITYPSGDDSVTTISTSIANTATDPVFYYYNENYPSDTVNNPLSTPVAVSRVRMIKVHLMVNIDPNHAPDSINIEAFAKLRNVVNY